MSGKTSVASRKQPVRGKRSRAQYQEPGTDSDFLESDYEMSEESKEEEEVKERLGKSKASKGLQRRRLVSKAKGLDDIEESKEVEQSNIKQKAEAKMNLKVSATLD